MKVVLVILSVIAASAAVSVFYLAARSGRFFKSLIVNAVFGAGIMILINLTSRFTGVEIPLNTYTALGSCVLGLPAVIFFLVMPFIFI